MGKTLPAKTKELQGTSRADRQKDSVSYTQITEIPKPEAWLSTRAKKLFKIICEMLITNRLLTNANVPLVAMMAEEFALYEKACKELKRPGTGEVMEVGENGYKQQSPWLAIRNQASKKYIEISSLFGMDPLSAQKVSGSGETKGDEFQQLIDKYK